MVPKWGKVQSVDPVRASPRPRPSWEGTLSPPAQPKEALPLRAAPRARSTAAPAQAAALTSPQYSEMNSFFCTDSLMKVPQPATSDGASNKCWRKGGKGTVTVGRPSTRSTQLAPRAPGRLHSNWAELCTARQPHAPGFGPCPERPCCAATHGVPASQEV